MKIDNHILFGAFTLVVATVLLVLGKLPSGDWTTTAQVIIVTLVGGNAITHTATKMASRGMPTATATATRDLPDP